MAVRRVVQVTITRKERNALRVSRYKAANESVDPYLTVVTKICYRCKEDLASRNFCIDKTKRDGLQSYCRVCARKQRMEALYNISYSKYELLLIEQNNKCAICRIVEHSDKIPLAVDHDHFDGHVRGLLCRACNKGLGEFFDDADRLKTAITYLESR